MRIIILGAAAGGGLPQWNCGCANCAAARSGRIPPMSQSSIAISADGQAWAIINASPDIRAQLTATPALHPAGLREMPLRSVLVTNGDIDHVAGLLTLRESQPFDLFGTETILGALDANPMMAAVNPDFVPRRPVALDQFFDLLPGLVATLFAVPGKVPLYLEGEQVETGQLSENTVGVELTTGDRRALYIPGCAELPQWLKSRIEGCDLLMFDGTLWQDGEMIAAGLGHKTGRRMGHMSADDSIRALAQVPTGQRIFVHINNSNPLTDPASPQSDEARDHGWQIGRDGMEITL
ncbi:MAG: pyrroloquinoline quinone biosynthesis protein PqqB [Paracoccus sp. (in: a-proteobacteria)]